MRTYSELFHHYYEIEDSIPIANTKQSGLYIKHNCPLLDLYWSNGTLVFVFEKNASRPLYEMWCRRELR